MACQTLGNIGTDAKGALPTLRSLLTDANQIVRQQAQLAIAHIEAKP